MTPRNSALPQALDTHFGNRESGSSAGLGLSSNRLHRVTRLPAVGSVTHKEFGTSEELHTSSIHLHCVTCTASCVWPPLLQGIRLFRSRSNFAASHCLIRLAAVYADTSPCPKRRHPAVPIDIPCNMVSTSAFNILALLLLTYLCIWP